MKKAKRAKKGFTASSFDLLHAGHIAMLRESKDNCDYLIVGLNTNPCKNGRYPVQNVVERYTQLKAVSYIDEIIPYNNEKELIDLILLNDIDIRFIGEDYKNKPFTGDNLPIEIFYNSRRHDFSSSTLKTAVVKNQEKPKNIVKDNSQYLLTDENMTDLVLSKTILKPTQETNGHSHDDKEEVYIFESGSGIIIIGDNHFGVYPGLTKTIKFGEFHKVINSSNSEDLVFHAVFAGRRD